MFVGMQHTYESTQGDANYRLRVAYNGSNLVTRDVIEEYDADAQEITYVRIKYVQMFQEVSSIAIWNPVSAIIFASTLLPSKTTQTSLPRSIGLNNNEIFQRWQQVESVKRELCLRHNREREQPVST
ncbi:MAG: hypothetical protein ACKPKO_42830, partial [Candidatus Fonsibacter sp.]